MNTLKAPGHTGHAAAGFLLAVWVLGLAVIVSGCGTRGPQAGQDLMDKATAGDPQAAYEVGLALQEKGGDSRAEAGKWFSLAAEKGHAKAQAELGLMYLNGIGVQPDIERAGEWFTRAALQGETRAQHQLALMYDKGYGVRRSPAEAARWYREAALDGVIDCQVRLGTLLREGRGTSQDFGQATHWFETARKAGDPRALTEIGVMHLQGLGVVRDPDLAEDLFRKAANRGDPRAYNLLGEMHLRGTGVEADPDDAEKWFRLAVAADSDEGRVNLADLYMEGHSFWKGADEAFELYMQAAQNGHADASYKVGLLYLEVDGPLRVSDPAQAALWLEQAATQGHPRAQARLARLYQDPPPDPGDNGVEQDYTLAYKWYRLAADQDYLQGQAGLDELLPLMSQAQVKRGKWLVMKHHERTGQNRAG